MSALIALCIGFSADATVEFGAWKLAHGKSYGTIAEEAHRQSIWLASRDRVAAHNARDSSWTAGLNAFSDLTWDEFSASRLIRRRRRRLRRDDEEGQRAVLDRPQLVGHRLGDGRLLPDRARQEQVRARGLRELPARLSGAAAERVFICLSARCPGPKTRRAHHQ